jgi:hypothetical protein
MDPLVEERVAFDKAVVDARAAVAWCEAEYVADREYVIECHKKLIKALDAVTEFRDKWAIGVRDHMRLSKMRIADMEDELKKVRQQRDDLIETYVKTHDTKGS